MYNENKVVEEEIEDQLVLINKTIKKVGNDISSFDFNTAVSEMMIFVNSMLEQETVNKNVLEKFLIVLAPFAPHLAEELYECLGKTDSVFKSECNNWWNHYAG